MKTTISILNDWCSVPYGYLSDSLTDMIRDQYDIDPFTLMCKYFNMKGLDGKYLVSTEFLVYMDCYSQYELNITMCMTEAFHRREEWSHMNRREVELYMIRYGRFLHDSKDPVYYKTRDLNNKLLPFEIDVDLLKYTLEDK